MRGFNSLVTVLLESPFHRLCSGSVDVVRYTGIRTGTVVSTPTQYARRGDGLIILVGHADRKRWWRNFRRDHDLEVLVDGRWLHMVGRVVLASDEPALAAQLREVYVRRFPRAARSIGASPVLVWCRPR